jgi:hypothetical protein
MVFGIAETGFARGSPPGTTTEVLIFGFPFAEIRFVSHIESFQIWSSLSTLSSSCSSQNPRFCTRCLAWYLIFSDPFSLGVNLLLSKSQLILLHESRDQFDLSCSWAPRKNTEIPRYRFCQRWREDLLGIDSWRLVRSMVKGSRCRLEGGWIVEPEKSQLFCNC